MYPNQNYAPHMFRGSHMENNTVRPPENLNPELFDESSKKRKSVATDQPGLKSRTNYEYNSPFGSNQSYESLQRKGTGPPNFRPQYANDQFHYQNSFPRPLETNNLNNFIPNASQNFGNIPLPSPPQSSAGGRSFARPIWQPQACNVVSSRPNNQFSNNGGVNNFANNSSSSQHNGVQYGGLQQINHRGVKDVPNQNSSFPQAGVQYGGLQQNNQYLSNEGLKGVPSHNSSFQQNGVQYGGLQQNNQSLDNGGLKGVPNHNYSFLQNGVQIGGLQQNNQSLDNGGLKGVPNHNSSFPQNEVQFGGLQQNNQSLDKGGLKGVPNHNSSFQQNEVPCGGLQQNNQSLDNGGLKGVPNHNSSFQQNGVPFGGLQQNNQSLKSGGIESFANHNYGFQQNGVLFGGLQQNSQPLDNGGVKDFANHTLPQNGVQYRGLQQNNQSLDNRSVKNVPNDNSSFQQNGVQYRDLHQNNQYLNNGGVKDVANNDPRFQQNRVQSRDLQQNNQSLNNGCVKDVPNHNSGLQQIGVEYEATKSFGVPSSDISESRVLGKGAGSVRELKKIEQYDGKNINYSILGVSPISCNISKSVETSLQKDSNILSSVEKDKLDDDKAAPTVAEKLWEGSLQLSSTVTVPSVAFFKSGEKLVNTSWYKSVEVKGKVRLEAFEKYIEDLPCSHNKGLMVLSLCLKEGSSETELKSMKEVVRGYTKTNRVGFAHLAREIHLYICPRSDAIITILAKYGFFKGMAAMENKQDSMIGCVIWRRSRTPTSNSVANKPETKNKSRSESPDEDSDLEDSPLTQLIQDIVAPLSATFTSTVNSDGENDVKCSKKSPSKTQIDVGVTLEPGNSNLSSHQVAQGVLTMVTNQQINCLPVAAEQPKEHFSFQNTIIIPSAEIVKEKRSLDDDDDDLPEFDFRVTCKSSLSNVSKPQETETLGKGLVPNLVQKMEEPVQRKVPIEPPNLRPIRPNVIENQIANSSVTNPVIASKKNFFDDDDMPEWCPPEQKICSQSGTIRPHTMPSTFPAPNFQNSPRGPISSQGFFHAGHFHTPQPRPLQRGPKFENMSHSDPILRTPENSHDNRQSWGPR